MMKLSDHQQLPQLITGTLQEFASVLAQLPAGFYDRALPLLEGNSIGMHVRHVIEFFECLIQQAPAGQVDYDLRQRQTHIEQNKQAAMDMLTWIQSHLQNVKHDFPLQLQSLVLPGTEKIGVPTTFFRELIYNLEHTVHHAALIRVAVLHYHPEVRLPETFGLAPSTVKFRQHS